MHGGSAGALILSLAHTHRHTQGILHLKVSVGEFASKCQLREKHWNQLYPAEVVQFCCCGEAIDRKVRKWGSEILQRSYMDNIKASEYERGGEWKWVKMQGDRMMEHVPDSYINVMDGEQLQEVSAG